MTLLGMIIEIIGNLQTSITTVSTDTILHQQAKNVTLRMYLLSCWLDRTFFNGSNTDIRAKD